MLPNWHFVGKTHPLDFFLDMWTTQQHRALDSDLHIRITSHSRKNTNPKWLKRTCIDCVTAKKDVVPVQLQPGTYTLGLKVRLPCVCGTKCHCSHEGFSSVRRCRLSWQGAQYLLLDCWWLFAFLEILLYVYECLCTTYVPIACGGQKRTLDPLELELKEGASVYVLETGALQEQVLYIFEQSF